MFFNLYMPQCLELCYEYASIELIGLSVSHTYVILGLI